MKEPEQKPCACGCGDAFAGLPPGQRPRAKKADDLVLVTCAQCGRVFWTNGKSKLCFDCKTKAPQAASSA